MFPSHVNSILIARFFSPEAQFIKLCKELGRCSEVGGQEYYDSPYERKPIRKPYGKPIEPEESDQESMEKMEIVA